MISQSLIADKYYVKPDDNFECKECTIFHEILHCNSKYFMFVTIILNSISPVLFSCGIGSSGIGLSRNEQSGSQPSFKFQTSKSFAGTTLLTYKLCFS